jgi:bifunctional non-homologous end joining protein LigD
VIEIVQESRDRLSRLKLECFLKATGGKGLHLVVPIQRRHSWAEINQFAKSLAEQIVADSPNDCTTNIRKSARAGKIFIDVLRNSQGATAIAPFSTRANPDASVAVPLAWDELSTDIHSDSFDVISAAQRLRSLGRDPWEHFFELKQSLSHWKRG